MNIEKAKTISVVDYLDWKGYQPCAKHGKELFYRSPFREEVKPSFCVDPNKNVWTDFGEKADRPGRRSFGGTTHQLAAALCGSMSAGLADLAKFCGKEHHPCTVEIADTTHLLAVAGNAYRNHRIITHDALIAYLQSRKIDAKIAKRFCFEVWYKPSGGDKHKYSIGLQNLSGGWDLRSKDYKSTIAPKDVSLISFGASRCLIFEGMIDMLSYMTLLGTKEKIESVDWLCMNSVNFVLRAIEIIKGKNYSEVRIYTDNDRAGHDAAESILKSIPTAKDCRHGFIGFKDVNEWLCQSTSLGS